MDRRSFLLGSFAWTTSVLAVPANQWTAGKDYVALPSRTLSTSARSGAIEVTEVFAYTCSHCYRFESYIQKWLSHQPIYIEFGRIPGIWEDWQRPFARLYYTLQLLKRSDLDRSVFEAIHRDNSLPTRNPDVITPALVKFAEKHSIAKDRFEEVYNSPAVQARFEEGLQLMKSYQITETPSIVVNGKYMTNVSHLSGGTRNTEEAIFQALMDLTSDLVAREAAALNLPASGTGASLARHPRAMV
jgi:thiol:disulfide interchange protein DsbA